MVVRNALMPFRLPEAADVGNLTSPLMQGLQTYRQGMAQQFEGDRALAREDMARQQLQLSKNADARSAESHEVTIDKARVERLAGLAQMIDGVQDPTQRQAMWGKVVADPKMRASLAKYMDPNDHVAGPKFLLAQARGYVDPLDEKLKRAQLASAGAQVNMTNAQLQQMKLATPEKRAEIAARYGLQPGTPAYQSFTLLGTLPTKGEESTLDKEVAKTRVDMAEKDIKAGVGAQDMNSVLVELDALSNDKGLSAAIGPIQGTTTAQTVAQAVPFARQFGLANPELNAKLQRFQSQLVVAGGEKMKGLGAQSDADAARLQEAVGKLTSARTEKEFQDSISIIRQSVAGALQRGQSAARQFPQLGAGRIVEQAPSAPKLEGRAPAGQMPRISSDAEYNALPSGTQYTAPDGTIRTKR